MNKTKIEWCQYTINPVKGLCPVACPYCYARRMYRRYKWDEAIRFEQSAFFPTTNIKPGSRVFVGSTIELFGEWVKDEWLNTIFNICSQRSDVTWIFLTKRPDRLLRWSPFPENCWVGVSATNLDMAWDATCYLDHIRAEVKFISFEPLLSSMHSTDNKNDYTRAIIHSLNWLIIGQQTPVSAKTLPRREWIQEIIQAADTANIPVFLKNNLKELLPLRQHYREDHHDKCYRLRQELPR